MKNEEFNEDLLKERLTVLKSLENTSKPDKKLTNEIKYLENIIINGLYRNEV